MLTPASHPRGLGMQSHVESGVERGFGTSMVTAARVGTAWLGLVIVDVTNLLGVKKTYALLRHVPRIRRARPESTSRWVWAVDEAAIWYWKRVYCLQRSAVLTGLLRMNGIEGTLVIGFRPVPLDSHAWVEVAGQVVNDRPQYQKVFRVLDRV